MRMQHRAGRIRLEDSSMLCSTILYCSFSRLAQPTFRGVSETLSSYQTELKRNDEEYRKQDGADRYRAVSERSMLTS